MNHQRASRWPSLVTGLLLLTLLAACAGPQERQARSTADPTRPAGPAALLSDSSDPIDLGEQDDGDENAFAGNETFPGSGVFLNREAANRPAPIADGEGEVTLNFEAQGIQEVIHAILGHMLQENYVIAPGISGEVTFSTAKPISRDQIMPILEMLLRWNGATLIWREDRYHVLPVAQAIRGNLTPRVAGGDMGRGYQVVAVPLEFVAAPAMVTILEPYAREDAILSADSARSMLFLAGTPAELRNYMQIIETFDVDWLDGMSVGFFEISRVEVAELVAELEAVLGGEGETPVSGLFRILPFERLNSIMVITPNARYLETIETWIQRLDRSSPEAGSRLFVYRVKNLDADVLAGYLANVFGGESGGSATQRQDRGSLAPGLERAQVSSVSEFQNETGPQARAQNQGQNQNQRAGGGTVTLGDNGDVRITAVLETNSLLIQASPSEYDAILNAIERLDEEPLQVLIEAQVLQVELTDALRYGVSWFLSNLQPDDPNFPGFPGGEDSPNFSQSRDQDRSIFGSGLDFLTTITRRATDRSFITATVRALESVSDVRTISAPSLMVRNNSDASINVGQQIPVESQRISGVNDNTIGTVQYLNTGTILNVTPRVNPGGLVYLTVSQEVSSPGTTIGDASNPPINNRQVTTDVAVQSGQTIVLGGLISQTERDDRSGVPFLQRIPGLGSLFRSTNTSVIREETLVLITPTVITNTSQLERASREFESKFRAIEPLNGPLYDEFQTHEN
ncbi:MAG: type II secretion system secretin GspD [Pseudomonadota bacterium]